MDHLIAKIGKGLKGAKDLTWEEAKLALNSIIEGQVTERQIGAFTTFFIVSVYYRGADSKYD